MKTRETIEREFDEKFLTEDSLSSLSQFKECVSGKLPELFKSFINKTRLDDLEIIEERVEGLLAVFSEAEHNRRRDTSTKGGYELAIEDILSDINKLMKGL